MLNSCAVTNDNFSSTPNELWLLSEGDFDRWDIEESCHELYELPRIEFVAKKLDLRATHRFLFDHQLPDPRNSGCPCEYI